MRRKRLLLIGGALLFSSVITGQASGQSDQLQKYEVGAQFTSITKPDYSGGSTEIGPGARFTFNFNRSVAVEAATNFFPHSCYGCGRGQGDNSGNILQGFAGMKIGKRFERWGIFAKARPGFVSFSRGDRKFIPTGSPGVYQFSQQRQTHFATDLGGVLEFYPSKRIVTRFDAGDTLIKYGRHETNYLLFDPFGGVTLVPFPIRAETRHNFQFSAGVGFRF
jgi:hypothetical protein